MTEAVHASAPSCPLELLTVGRVSVDLYAEEIGLDWNEVTKVAHYYLSVDAMKKPMQVREDSPPYREHS